MRTQETTIRGGFTLAEILTTVAIIAILLAVLLPALSSVGKKAAEVKQKAQFHGIEIALETFRSDIGDYPPSAWDVAKYGNYSASQRLAEAIIGRDGFGFHPASRYHWDGRALDNTNNPTIKLYAPEVNLTANPDNPKARKGPYMELESANAVNIKDYSIDYDSLINPNLPSFVLADSFKSTKTNSGRKVGMPILYYKADRTKTNHSDSTIPTNTYNVWDSLGDYVNLKFDGIASKPDGKHPMQFSIGWFYQRTQNPNFTNPPRPYRAESFILHSAGPDGLYGTADDVFNFDEEK